MKIVSSGRFGLFLLVCVFAGPLSGMFPSGTPEPSGSPTVSPSSSPAIPNPEITRLPPVEPTYTPFPFPSPEACHSKPSLFEDPEWGPPVTESALYMWNKKVNGGTVFGSLYGCRFESEDANGKPLLSQRNLKINLTECYATYDVLPKTGARFKVEVFGERAEVQMNALGANQASCQVNAVCGNTSCHSVVNITPGGTAAKCGLSNGNHRVCAFTCPDFDEFRYDYDDKIKMIFTDCHGQDNWLAEFSDIETIKGKLDAVAKYGSDGSEFFVTWKSQNGKAVLTCSQKNNSPVDFHFTLKDGDLVEASARCVGLGQPDEVAVFVNTKVKGPNGSWSFDLGTQEFHFKMDQRLKNGNCTFDWWKKHGECGLNANFEIRY